MPSDLPTGIVRTPRGYRTFQWVPHPAYPHGRLRSKRWPATASLKEMIVWREEQRAHARRPVSITETEPTLTGFAADVVTYLEAVRAMPTFRERAKHIGEWLAVFADRQRAEITSTEIRTQRDRWRTVGPRRVLQKVQGQKATWIELATPLSASSVNHRLRALENMYTVLDGKHATNPVREVPECDEPDQEPRGHTFALALEILSYMPDVTAPKKGGAVEAGSLSRVRFEAMLWTGLPAVQLARLKPELVDWIAGTVLVPRRQKGKRARRARRRQERPRPLLPQAKQALKRFFALRANRAFSSSSLGQSVKRAIRAANRARATKHRPMIPTTLTVYDLTRHTFGTEVYRASKNLKAVQDLLGHSDINQSARYALAAVTEHTKTAVRQLGVTIRSAAADTARRRKGRKLTQ